MHTALDNCLDRNTYFGLEGVIDHVFELLLRLNLVIEDSERNIFQEGESMPFSIDHQLLIDDSDQKGRFLLIFNWAIARILLVLLIWLFYHLVLSHINTRNGILKNNLVNLPCFKSLDWFNQAHWLPDWLNLLFHPVVFYLVTSLSEKNLIQYLWMNIFWFENFIEYLGLVLHIFSVTSNFIDFSIILLTLGITFHDLGRLPLPHHDLEEKHLSECFV